MLRILTAATLAASLAVPLAAQANGHGQGNAQVQKVAAEGCPPGLAKKDTNCTPPGLAKKGVNQGFQRGDTITGDYTRIKDPARYGLDPNRSYYRVGDQVYRVDKHTKEVLDVIGAVAALMD